MNKRNLQDIIGECKTIVEVGSYNGFDASELHSVFKCKVHCFEPNPVSFIESKSIILNKCAVGDKDGYCTFYVSDHPQSSSVNRPDNHLKIWPKIGFNAPITVPCIKLNTWWNKTNKPDIDLLWIDANGNEFWVISGASDMLERTRYAYVEVSDKDLYEQQASANRIIEYMNHFGWRVHSLYDFGENFGNILFKNTKL